MAVKKVKRGAKSEAAKPFKATCSRCGKRRPILIWDLPADWSAEATPEPICYECSGSWTAEFLRPPAPRKKPVRRARKRRKVEA